jgi:hypothetical protein
MNNKTFLVFFLVITSFSQSFGKEIIKSQFAQDIVVDGKSNDWADKSIYANSDLKLMFSIANDKDNLYLYIKSLDRMSQQQIRMNGIECWISAKGKKKKKMGFVFPYIEQKPDAPVQVSYSSDDLKRDNATLRGYEKSESVTQKIFDKILLKGLSGYKDGVAAIDSIDFKAAIKKEQGDALIIEFKIPLKSFSTPADFDNVIAIGLGVKENKSSSSSHHHDSDSSPRMGRGNRMGGGGMGAGGMQGSPNNPSQGTPSLNNEDIMPGDPRNQPNAPYSSKINTKVDIVWIYTTLSK